MSTGPGPLRSIFSTPPVGVGLEIATHRVTAVSLARGRQGPAAVTVHASEPLPPGALSPALNGPNVADRAAVHAAVARVLEQVGRPGRVALVVPDTAAKVSLVRFETMPRAQELEQFVRWQVRKAAPFPIEAAQVSWSEGMPLEGGGRELVVTVMRRDVVEEYEAACVAAGAHAGIVDIATSNLVNVALLGDGLAGAPAARDWMLVHLTLEYSTLAIVRGEHLIFYRNRVADEGELADIVHQTAMYYEDRLGGTGFGRVVLATSDASLAGEAEVLRHTLAERLRSPVDTLDPRRAATLTDRTDVAPELLAALSAPVGLVLRDA